MDEREEPKSNTAVVAVVIALGVLGALALAGVILGGVSFLYISRAQSDAEVAVMEMQRAMHPVADADLAEEAAPIIATKPSRDELLDAAKKVVLAQLPNANNVAWSEPTIEDLDGGWYRLTGALTTEGRSLRWTCEITPIERDGQRDWDRKQLRIEE